MIYVSNDSSDEIIIVGSNVEPTPMQEDLYQKTLTITLQDLGHCVVCLVENQSELVTVSVFNLSKAIWDKSRDLRYALAASFSALLLVLPQPVAIIFPS